MEDPGSGRHHKAGKRNKIKENKQGAWDKARKFWETLTLSLFFD